MKLILHELTHSPFCIPVRSVLDAYGVAFDRVEIPSWDRRGLANLTGGQYYQVPVLQHGDQVIHETESHPLAVAHYLDHTFASGELFPEHCAGIQEIVIGCIEDTLEGIGFRLSDPGYIDTIKDLGERTMVIRHKERKLGVGCVDQWRANAEKISAEFEASIKPYETRLGQSAYLFGDRPVYADYALLGVLGNAQHGGHYQLADRFTHLKRWESDLTGFKSKANNQ